MDDFGFCETQVTVENGQLRSKPQRRAIWSAIIDCVDEYQSSIVDCVDVDQSAIIDCADVDQSAITDLADLDQTVQNFYN